MSSAQADSIKHEWTGTGTSSPITLGGAVAGFQALPAEFNGLTINYLIESREAGVTERENGSGVYTHSGTTLARTAISASSNGGSAVAFTAGTKHVSLVSLASDRAHLFDTLDASAADVSWNGSLTVPIVQVTGHSVARNLDITPDPTSAFPARAVLVCNFGSGLLSVRDAVPAVIGTVAAGEIRQFDWDGSDWSAGRVWISGAVDYDNVETSSAAITISDATDRQNLITTHTSPIAVTLGNDTTADAITAVTKGSDQDVTVSVATDVQYYLRGDDFSSAGRTSSFKITGSATITCIRLDAGNRRYLVIGETDHEQTILNAVDFAGNIVAGNRAEVLTGVSGALTKAAHSGRVLVISGNVTVPNAAADIGFNATIIATGAQTVTFNSTTSPAMAAGDVMSVVVQSATVIKASLVAAADLVSFT